MATKETASPIARATGPSLCADAAVPSTIGTSGRTQGERIDSTPATNARPRLATVIGKDRSQHLVQQRGDGRAVGVADRTPLLILALEGDQRRLHPDAEALHQILLAVEIDHEIGKLLEFRIGHQLAQDRLLRLTSRTPGGVNRDEDRLAGLLRLGEGAGVEGLRIDGEGRGDQRRACGGYGEEDRAA